MNSQRSAAIYARISRDPGQTLEGVKRQVSDGLDRMKTLSGTSLSQLEGSPIDRRRPDAGRWPMGVFVDNDISARNTRKKRPEYDRLIRHIAGGDIDTVICYSQSRLWRNNVQRIQDLQALKDSETLLEFLTRGTIDLSKSADKLMVGLLGEVDTYEADVTAERQQTAARHFAKNGAYHGARPFGFTLAHLNPDGTTYHFPPPPMADGQRGPCPECEGRKAGMIRTLVPMPVEAQAVREAYELVAAGVSPYQVCRYFDGHEITSADGATISRAAVRTAGGHRWAEVGEQSLLLMLKAPRNIGRRLHSKGWHGGKRPEGQQYDAHWEGIVTADVFYAVQEILAQRAGPARVGGNRPAHLLTGFALCGKCGAKLVVHKIGGKRRYCCTTMSTGGCGGVSREALSVDTEIQRVLFEWFAGNGLLTKSVRMAANTDLQGLLRQRDKHEQQKRELDAKHSDGIYDDETYIRLRNRKAEIIDDLGKQMAAVKETSGGDLPTGAEFRTMWRTAGLAERRSIVGKFIDKVVVHPCGAGNDPDPLLIQVFPAKWAARLDDAQPAPPPDASTLTSRGQIEGFLKSHPADWFTREEVADGAGVTLNAAHKNLQVLGKQGKAARDWRRRGGQRACFMYSAGSGQAWGPRTRTAYERRERPRDMILRFMDSRPGEWFTLAEISEGAGLSARLPTSSKVVKDLVTAGFIARRSGHRPYRYSISGKEGP